MATTWKIPIKAGGSLEFTSDDLAALADNVYSAIIVSGMKDLLNRGMTKVKVKLDGKALEGEDLAKATAAAMEIASKNLANLKAGKLPRIAGVKASDGKIPGVVMTEARRLARNFIKDQIKLAGGKISSYSAKSITEAANAYLATDDGKPMLETAKANVAARDTAKEASAANVPTLADLTAKLGLTVDEKAVAAAEKKKASTGKDVLSAAQSGKPKQRSKGQPAQPNA